MTVYAPNFYLSPIKFLWLKCLTSSNAQLLSNYAVIVLVL